MTYGFCDAYEKIPYIFKNTKLYSHEKTFPIECILFQELGP